MPVNCSLGKAQELSNTTDAKAAREPTGERDAFMVEYW
jgi:hypothetical protein